MGLTRIEGGVFNGCTSLTEIAIPPRVTSIGGGARRNEGSWGGVGAFNDCTSLETIIFMSARPPVSHTSGVGHSCGDRLSFTVPAACRQGSCNCALRNSFNNAPIKTVYVPIGSFTAYGTTNVIGGNATYEIIEKEMKTGHNITVDGGGGSGTHFPGEVIQLTATPGPGQIFTGWFEGDNRISVEIEHTFVVPDRNVTLEARYTVARYTFDVTAGTGGTVSGGGGTFNHGETVTLRATPSTGYTFAGWFAENGTSVLSFEAVHTVTATSNRILEARFTPIRYEFSITRTNGGRASGGVVKFLAKLPSVFDPR
jgi:uncharacterized repeat protein (TIGR02543 family)